MDRPTLAGAEVIKQRQQLQIIKEKGWLPKIDSSQPDRIKGIAYAKQQRRLSGELAGGGGLRQERKRALCLSRCLCPRQLEVLNPVGSRFATLVDAIHAHWARTLVHPEPVCLAQRNLTIEHEERLAPHAGEAEKERERALWQGARKTTTRSFSS